ncbi:MAG: hypothetical protein LLG14_17245 [Nocardiaceae bacterium]|nr:hypothetical protein [Nocardiaceae bacterium]
MKSRLIVSISVVAVLAAALVAMFANARTLGVSFPFFGTSSQTETEIEVPVGPTTGLVPTTSTVSSPTNSGDDSNGHGSHEGDDD